MEQLPLVPRCDNARGQAGEVNGKAMFSASDLTPPVTTGQCAQVLNLIRQHQPLLSLVLTADHAILATYSLGTPEWPAPGHFAEVTK